MGADGTGYLTCRQVRPGATAPVPEGVRDGSGFPRWHHRPSRCKITLMGIYREHVLPRLQDKVMGSKRLREARGRVCEGLAGAVVEIGFGTGLNAPYYSSKITKVVAIEPSRVCMRGAARSGSSRWVDVHDPGQR